MHRRTTYVVVWKGAGVGAVEEKQAPGRVVLVAGNKALWQCGHGFVVRGPQE